MSTEFDSKKALQEEIQGLSNIYVTLSSQTAHAERQASEAAAHYDALVKLRAFADQELARKRAVLSELVAKESKG